MAEGTVVVTGGTGALGTGVTEVLLGAGFTPVVTWVMEREQRGRRGALRRSRAAGAARRDRSRTPATRSRRELDAAGGAWGLAHLVGGYRDGDPVAGMDVAGWEQQLDPEHDERRADDAGLPPRDGLPGRGPGRRDLEPGGAQALRGRSRLRGVKGRADRTRGRRLRRGEARRRHGQLPAAERDRHPGQPPERSPTPTRAAGSRPPRSARWSAFLMSRRSSAITGAAIPVYGRA